jgi:hypothetical protein
LVQADHPHRPRYQADYGYRGSGYVYGAFIPATGEAITAWYSGRCTNHWAEFLADVERWLSPQYARVVAIQDNLGTHFGQDIQLFSLAHPRWEFLNLPLGAGYLNLIEPWWKVLKGLALKGKRFNNWEDLSQAFHDATLYWNQHRHPFLWGQRKRYQPKRKPGIATMPGHRLTI